MYTLCTYNLILYKDSAQARLKNKLSLIEFLYTHWMQTLSQIYMMVNEILEQKNGQID